LSCQWYGGGWYTTSLTSVLVSGGVDFYFVRLFSVGDAIYVEDAFGNRF